MARERLYTDKISLEDLINKIALAEVMGKKEWADAFREVLNPFMKEDTNQVIEKKKQRLPRFMIDEDLTDGLLPFEKQEAESP